MIKYTLVITKIFPDHNYSIIPSVYQNLDDEELSYYLGDFVCTAQVDEYLEQIKVLLENKELIKAYKNTKSPYRQINDKVNGLVISINIFVD